MDLCNQVLVRLRLFPHLPSEWPADLVRPVVVASNMTVEQISGILCLHVTLEICRAQTHSLVRFHAPVTEAELIGSFNPFHGRKRSRMNG